MKKVLFPLLALVLALGMALPMAAPAMASEISATKNSPLPNIYHVGETIPYVMTVTNPATNTATNTVSEISDTLPDGFVIYFVQPGVDPPLVQDPGDSAIFTLDYIVDEDDLVTMDTGRVGVVNTFYVYGLDSEGDAVTALTQRNSRVIRPSIEILKTVDCDGDGEYLPVDVGSYGDTGHWRITVTNTSPDSGLHDVMVSDTNGQSFGPFDLENPGDSQQFDYDTPLVLETTTNIATAQGLDELSAVVGPVSSTAINEITISPAISILKTVDCDGDLEYLPVDVGSYGDDGAWRIVVTNTGDSPVLNIQVTDDLGPGFAPFDLLIPGEFMQLDYVTPGLTETTINEAMATGTDVLDNTVGPVYSSTTNVIEIEPCIDILKLVDCNEDGVYLSEDTGTSGDTPSWYIEVTNCGDSPLIDVMVSDTNGMSWGPFDLPNPGGTWDTTYVGAAIYETTTNTANVVATDVLGGTVSATDDATNIIVGGQGCTPGYWKNNAKKWDAVSWVGYDPDDSFNTVFGVNVELRGNGKSIITDPTLLEALDANGGGINALARHAVAALLNASNSKISYAMSEAAIIDAVHDALDSGDPDAIKALHTQLAGYNEAGCSIDMHGNPIIMIDG